MDKDNQASMPEVPNETKLVLTIDSAELRGYGRSMGEVYRNMAANDRATTNAEKALKMIGRFLGKDIIVTSGKIYGGENDKHFEADIRERATMDFSLSAIAQKCGFIKKEESALKIFENEKMAKELAKLKVDRIYFPDSDTTVHNPIVDNIFTKCREGAIENMIYDREDRKRAELGMRPMER